MLRLNSNQILLRINTATRQKKHHLITLTLMLCLFIVNTTLAKPQSSRSLKPIKNAAGQTVGNYGDSYALLIGVSQYKSWPNLNSIPDELDNVTYALKKQGFKKIIRVNNPNGRKLKTAFENFIYRYGYKPKNNRLLVYFAGHGFTFDDGEQGYLVPSDAPNPENDKLEFQRVALNMNRILSLSREMSANHALFLFDSCFSGAIFKQRNLPRKPKSRIIDSLTAKPVRQFITAGDAGETVPAKSTFNALFVDAMLYGLGDFNKDGYTTGTELGLYLQNEVPNYVAQTPQYGKINDYKLSRGDYVFFTGDKKHQSNNVKPLTSTLQQIVMLDRAFLTVETRPKNARIRILNIGPKYFDGIELEPGQYKIEVSAANFQAQTKWYGIGSGQWNLSVTLQKKHNKPQSSNTKTFRDCKICPEMVVIPKGRFRMGDLQGNNGYSDEKPVHQVNIGRKFALSVHETTFAEYDIFAESTGRNKPNDEDWGRDDRPVINVSFDDAIAYAKWLSRKTGKNYRLPSEAEWEYAARADSNTRYSWGNDIGKNRANCGNCSAVWDSTKTFPTGSFHPNKFRLYDMHGNVWEWVQDCYHNHYNDGSTWENGVCESRVLRGGAWNNKSGSLRSANRDRHAPHHRNTNVGFRLARTL